MGLLVCFVSGAVSSSAGKTTFSIRFPDDTTDAVASVRSPLLQTALSAFTLCYWCRSTHVSESVYAFHAEDYDRNSNTPSRFTSGFPYRMGRAGVVVNRDQLIHTSPLDLVEGRWLHVCNTWSLDDEKVAVFLNGDEVVAKTGLRDTAAIPTGVTAYVGGGAVKLPAGDLVMQQGWRGDISEVHLWDSVLANDQIGDISECNGPKGNVLAWSENAHVLMNGAHYADVTLCE